MLRTLPGSHKSNWKEDINKVVHAYNCGTHTVTGFSPFFLLFGWNPRLPIDAVLHTSDQEDEQQSYHQYVRPQLDYGDNIYDNSSNVSLAQMIESVQYNAELAITGTIHGSSREKLYEELGFKSLRDRHWYGKRFLYYKIRHNNFPPYLTEFLPVEKSGCYSLH